MTANNSFDRNKSTLFIILTLVFLIISLVINYLYIFTYSSNNRVYVNDNGSLIIEDSEAITSICNIPSNQIWYNTGVVINSDRHINIKASGSINLAVHRLVNSAEKDTKPRLGWMTPDGGELSSDAPCYSRRMNLLINPEVNYGALLGFIRPNGTPPPSVQNPRPKDLIFIGSKLNNHLYADSLKRSGTLYLTINDSVLSDDSDEYFLCTQEQLDLTYGKNNVKYDSIVKDLARLKNQRYWNVWYDDNIGNFLVEVKITQ